MRLTTAPALTPKIPNASTTATHEEITLVDPGVTRFNGPLPDARDAWSPRSPPNAMARRLPPDREITVHYYGSAG